MELSNFNIKKIPKFSPKNSVLAFSEMQSCKRSKLNDIKRKSNGRKNSFYFRKHFLKRKLSSYFWKRKHQQNFSCFRKWNPPQNSKYYRKQNIFIFQEKNSKLEKLEKKKH